VVGEQLAELIRAEHLAFATTGDPGWPRFGGTERRSRAFDPQPGFRPYPEGRSRAIRRDRRLDVLDRRT
jgi:para-nitrobenzyl esterase